MSVPSSSPALRAGRAMHLPGSRPGRRRSAPAARLLLGLLAGLLALGTPAAALGAPTPGPSTTTASTSPSPTTSPTTSPAPSTTASPSPTEPEEEADPLRVDLTDVSPAALPRSGPVRITGTVRNTDDETWTDINVHPFLGPAPMTSADELVAAAASDARSFTGERIIAEGAYATISSLAPGEAASFSIQIGRDDLPAPVDATGVYWFGVHALASSTTGRTTAGRARTFLPAVARPNRQEPIDTAIVAPIRRSTSRAADGSVAGADRWNRDLAPEGRLANLVSLGEAADVPITWLVDPAVADSAEHLAGGNAPRELGPPPEQPPPSEEPGPEPADEGEEGTTASVSPLPVASEWVGRLTAMLADNDVLALPYGDLDSNAAVRFDPDRAADARATSTATLERLGISATPAVAPPDGRLSAEAIADTPADEQLLLADTLLDPASAGAARAIADGRPVTLTSAAVTAGGPGPHQRRSVLGVRQRILAEAVVRMSAESPAPLVASLPAAWDPGAAPELFLDGLDQPWLNLVGLDRANDAPAVAVTEDQLAAAIQPRSDGLTAANFTAVDELLSTAGALQSALTGNETLAGTVLTEALPRLSWSSGNDARAAHFSTLSATRWLRSRMARIRLEAPAYVTLASTSGRLPVTVVNDLEHSVTVLLSAHSDSPVRVDAGEPVTIPPGARASVLINASSERIGVHTVEIRVTDPEGVPLGPGTEVRIRSAQVSQVIWFVIAGGAALLVGAIVLRVVRRVRRGPADEPGGESGDEA